MNSPISLLHKLEERKKQDAYRTLRLPAANLVDFCSNDYLGIVKNGLLEEAERLSNVRFQEERDAKNNQRNYPSSVNAQPSTPRPLSGSTGSRLLAGNYELIERVEQQLAAFYEAETALIFNSGYDANIGLLSCIAQKGDAIIYDALSHASIRDGIRLSFAQAFSFAHNNVEDLEKKLKHATGTVYVVTESVFSMDGDLCPLPEIVALCQQYNAYLIIDEAHATGVIGMQGEGLAQQLQLHKKIFARVHTFGKACGCHGAVILGSEVLKNYLVNFARSFIYSTALPPHAVNYISKSYQLFPAMLHKRVQLQMLIQQFQNTSIQYEKLPSQTPIQAVLVPGNEAVRHLAENLQQQGFDVRPILYPTVPKGKERLRIVLHSFNTKEEVNALLNLLK